MKASLEPKAKARFNPRSGFTEMELTKAGFVIATDDEWSQIFLVKTLPDGTKKYELIHPGNLEKHGIYAGQ